jgi:MRG-binding protein
MRATVSAPSSPIPPPESPLLSASTLKRRNSTSRKRGKSKSKLSLAGLVGGDSDSSALTQESGDEGPVTMGTPRDSVLTGTDAGTDYAEDFDVDMREPSPARSASPRPTRGRPPKNSKRGRGGATRGTSTRAVKKRKR